MEKFSADTALVIVDVQYDFMPGGSLPVPAGDEVVPAINRMVPRFAAVFTTQDWHPAGHISFASAHEGRKPGDVVGGNMVWPDHCVEGTHGAALAEDLQLPADAEHILKGRDLDRDSYSAFGLSRGHEHESLAARLRERGIRKVYVVGLALDFCVLYTALDAAKEGFATAVVLDGCRGIDVNGSVAAALRSCREAGVQVLESLS